MTPEHDGLGPAQLTVRRDRELYVNRQPSTGRHDERADRGVKGRSRADRRHRPQTLPECPHCDPTPPSHLLTGRSPSHRDPRQ